MSTILIIDDDKSMSAALMQTITALGHAVSCAYTLADGLRKSVEANPDIVFLDVYLPDGDGLAALGAVRSAPSQPEVIIFTGEGDPDSAETAIRSGAWDYLQKPATVSSLALLLRRALDYRSEKRSRRPAAVLRRGGLVGDSARMRESLDLLAQAAATDSAVLLTGETGAGKELFAAAIHDNSARAAGNFVVVDCTALPETLVESLLFGHEKGAFTGADRPAEGLIRQADGGTLFLDEAGELPLLVQKAFLRVLQEHRFRPLGGSDEVTSDFRLIAATNRDLDRMVQQGAFREDLLFRLRSFHLEVPPLRERRDDIRPLVTYHLDRLCRRRGGATKGISPEFVEALERYDWPGNVRELVQTIEQAIAASHDEPVLHPHHLPLSVRVHAVRSSIRAPHYAAGSGEALATASDATFPKFRSYRSRAVDAAEHQYLTDVMDRAGRNLENACALSGLSRPRLYALLAKHGIKRKGPGIGGKGLGVED
jgi:two-component system NtrC family response regulator